jgi:hypothetical protein
VLERGPQVHARIVASPNAHHATAPAARPLCFRGTSTAKGDDMSLLWIILIVVLVLALLGFFGRSYW